MDTKISPSFYRNHTITYFRGRQVRSLCPLRNGLGEQPAGTVYTIERKWKGFSLISEPCGHCGLRLSMTEVPYEDVELLSKLTGVRGGG